MIVIRLAANSLINSILHDWNPAGDVIEHNSRCRYEVEETKYILLILAGKVSRERMSHLPCMMYSLLPSVSCRGTKLCMLLSRALHKKSHVLPSCFIIQIEILDVVSSNVHWYQTISMTIFIFNVLFFYFLPRKRETLNESKSRHLAERLLLPFQLVCAELCCHFVNHKSVGCSPILCFSSVWLCLKKYI